MYATIVEKQSALPLNYFASHLKDLAMTADYIRLTFCQAWDDELDDENINKIEHPNWFSYDDGVPRDFMLWWGLYQNSKPPANM